MRYGGFRFGETADQFLARAKRIDAILADIELNGASDVLIAEILSVAGETYPETATNDGFPDNMPSRARQRQEPSVRYIYFLRAAARPHHVKIGLASSLSRRLREHRKEVEFDVLGVMRWRNQYPDEQGLFEGKRLAAFFSGRDGTVRMAEKLIHGLFERERLDKRKRAMFGVRHEWFRASPRLLAFVRRHTVAPSDMAVSPLHELEFVANEEWCVFRLPSRFTDLD